MPFKRANANKREWAIVEPEQQADNFREWTILPNCNLVVTDHLTTACCKETKDILMRYRKVNGNSVYVRGAVTTVWADRLLSHGKTVRDMLRPEGVICEKVMEALMRRCQ